MKKSTPTENMSVEYHEQAEGCGTGRTKENTGRENCSVRLILAGDFSIRLLELRKPGSAGTK